MTLKCSPSKMGSDSLLSAYFQQFDQKSDRFGEISEHGHIMCGTITGGQRIECHAHKIGSANFIHHKCDGLLAWIDDDFFVSFREIYLQIGYAKTNVKFKMQTKLHKMQNMSKVRTCLDGVVAEEHHHCFVGLKPVDQVR